MLHVSIFGVDLIAGNCLIEDSARSISLRTFAGQIFLARENEVVGSVLAFPLAEYFDWLFFGEG